MLRQRYINSRPGIFFLIMAALWNLTCIFGSRSFFPALRFLRANRLSSVDYCLNSSTVNQIDILFVAAGSDIKMLSYSIPAAIKSIRGGVTNPKITVIVPSSDLPRCTELIGSGFNIKISCEDDYINASARIVLRDKFTTRFGWTLQQLLKIEFLLQSDASGVLVVDADTLLLNSRNWLHPDGRQILTPSGEFHKSYYQFLNKFGVSTKKPKFTFVPHHMLLQPKYVREIMKVTGWDNINNLINTLSEFQFQDMDSPFSIDYEAYAQYMMNNHPDKIILSKWSNIAVKREENLEKQIPALAEKFSNNYHSISFHAYL